MKTGLKALAKKKKKNRHENQKQRHEKMRCVAEGNAFDLTQETVAFVSHGVKSFNEAMLRSGFSELSSRHEVPRRQTTRSPLLRIKAIRGFHLPSQK